MRSGEAARQRGSEVARMMRASLTHWSLSLLLAGCAGSNTGSDCGEGTMLQGGQCVPALACGPGTVQSGGQCLVGTGAAGAPALATGQLDGKATPGLIYLQSVMTPLPPDCLVQASPTGVTQSQGRLDVSLRTDYTASLLVANRLTPLTTEGGVGSDTAAQIESATVRVIGADGAELVTFTSSLSGFVPAAQDTTPGYGVVTAVLVPPALGQDWAGGQRKLGPVTALVKLSGHTLGGSSFSTGELPFPIAVCRGCLVYFPQDAVDPTEPQPNCRLKGDTQPMKACWLGQDVQVDCRQCVAQYAACAGQ